MIEIARVTMLGGASIIAARKQYPASPAYFIECSLGERKEIVDDMQWAERVREGMADHGDDESARDFVLRQVEGTCVMEDRLSLKVTVVLSALRRTVELATKVA